MASSTKKITDSGKTYDSGTYAKQVWTETTAAGANTYAIQDTATSVKLNLTGTSGDVVYVEGLSGEYFAKMIGSTLTLVSDTQRIVISMPKGAATTLAFLDGTATVNTTTKTLGAQKLASIGKVITTAVDDASPIAIAALNYFEDAAGAAATIYTLSSTAVTAQEGSALTFQLTLDTAPIAPVTVNYNTVAGTATTADFTSVAGTVTFAAGQKVAFVTVPTVSDSAIESTETLTLNVSGANVKSATTAAGADIAIAGSIADATKAAAASSILTLGQDSIVGTGADETFDATIVNNSNTFQSGDNINGGAGVDTLNVELGNSSAFAIRATTQNVEKFVATVQSTNGTGSSGTNNVDTTGQKVTIDAEKMVGVKEFWNTDSRADLKIEDIRIDVPGQTKAPVTSDVTIGLRNMDPGSINPANVLTGVADNKVDYEVYFSPESLRPGDSLTSSTLLVSVKNVVDRTLFDGIKTTAPLTGIPYTTLKFQYNGGSAVGGGEISLPFAAAFAQKYGVTAKITTNAHFKEALQLAISDIKLENPLYQGLTLEDDGLIDYSSKEANPELRKTPQYKLSWPEHTLSLLGLKPEDSWVSSGTANSTNGFGADLTDGTKQSTNPLITSTIVLDNVGREDEAGTLTIGSMSTHGGVERFEITVENNGDNAYTGTQSGSWLGHMQSTSNTLQEVKVVNSQTGITNPDYLYLGTNMDQAGNNLTVMQDWPGSLDRIYNQITPMFSNGYKTTISTDGDTQQNVSSLLNPNGLVDVRLFDASEMKGNVYVGASITADTIRKYQNLVDKQAIDGTDDVAFKYLTGNANDSINLQIDGTVAASNSSIVSGRHDFSFSVDGGAGDDNIRVSLTNGLSGNAENWYDNQDVNNNVTVVGGAGNDTIRTPGAGDMRIDAGSGDDTVYTDNTGKQSIFTRNADGSSSTTSTSSNAVYAFNAVDTNGVLAGGYNVFDLRSQAVASVSAVNAYVTVNYLGIQKSVYIANSYNASTNVAITDLAINQAIKEAINGITQDATINPGTNNNAAALNKLLMAQDGPGRTLLVSSLIDGTDGIGDLTVAFGSTPLTTTQTGLAGITLFGSTNLGYAALTDGYAVTFAQDNNGTPIVGAPSTTTSDNVILPGADNDVIVLGTTVGVNSATSSNETVVFAPGFGNDTIVNFDVSGVAIDHLDFRALNGFETAVQSYNSVVNNVNNSINIGTVVTSTTVTEQKAVENFFASNSTATDQNHVFVVDRGHNIGAVYTVNDLAGTNNAVAALQGTIDLAYTTWSSLTAANFANSSAANYHLVEGANTLNVAAPVVVPTATLTSSAATINEGGAVTYTATLTGGTSATPLSIPYTLSGTGITTGDIGGTALTGNINIAAGTTTGTLTLNATNDLTTEGTETLTITLGATAGVNLGTAATSTAIADTSITPVAGGPTTTNLSAAALTGTGTVGNDTFNIASGTYTATIAGFGQTGADKIALFAGASVSILPDANQADGIQQLTAADAATGSTATITLTGLTPAQDAGVFNTASFNTIFGAGSLA